MTDKNMLFVFNPRSGRAQIKNVLLDVVNLFVKNGYEVTVHPTQSKLDAYKTVARIGDQFDLVVCSGGDGTLNESVRGLMECGGAMRLGYLPSGTTNDFGSTMGLPKNLTEAARIIMEGEEFPCDIGSFNDLYFTYVAAFGAFTEVAYATPQQSKNILGHLAYVMEGIKRLSNIAAYHMVVEHDGIQEEGDYAFGMVSNSMSVGGFRGRSDMGIVLDDGLFEVALIALPQTPAELQQTLNALLKRDFHTEGITFFRTSELKITCEDRQVAWTLDGEYGGTVTEAVIKNHKQAITFLRSSDVGREEILSAQEALAKAKEYE